MDVWSIPLSPAVRPKTPRTTRRTRSPGGGGTSAKRACASGYTATELSLFNTPSTSSRSISSQQPSQIRDFGHRRGNQLRIQLYAEKDLRRSPLRGDDHETVHQVCPRGRFPNRHGHGGSGRDRRIQQHVHDGPCTWQRHTDRLLHQWTDWGQDILLRQRRGQGRVHEEPYGKSRQGAGLLLKEASWVDQTT